MHVRLSSVRRVSPYVQQEGGVSLCAQQVDVRLCVHQPCVHPYVLWVLIYALPCVSLCGLRVLVGGFALAIPEITK